MKTLALIVLLSGISFAGGPKYTYKTPPGLDDEMHNIYHDISNPKISYGQASSMTFVNNATGSGSAALGANCPASTVGAPYTWLVMISSDGTKVYVPAWK